LHPAQKGKGIIAGGAVRVITELGGVRDIVCKVHGTKNAGSVVRATIDGFKQLQTIEEYAAKKGVDASTAQQKRSDATSKKKGKVASAAGKKTKA
jgi:small subunit ribosomal protein S5